MGGPYRASTHPLDLFPTEPPVIKSKKQYVSLEDEFPVDLLIYLLIIPSDDEVTEPPQKRQCTERPEAIPIAKDIFSIRRNSESDVLITNTILRVDAHHYLNIVHNEEQSTLTISSASRSPYGQFKSEISLGQAKFPDNVKAILEVLGRSRDDESQDGALWVSVMVELERHPSSREDEIRFYLMLNWNSSTDTLRSQRSLSQSVIKTFFESRAQRSSSEKLSAWAFYDAAFTSEKSHSDPFTLFPPKLVSTLFPFQRRALQWLLNREGVEWKDECANEKPGLELFSNPPTNLPLSFRMVEDASGQSFYMSDLFHVVNRNITPFRNSESAVKGGILAEEMGLGKTVEIIALICTHIRNSSPTAPSPFFHDGIASGATLIVTPLALKNQWISEFDKHAPHLNVVVYEGLKGFNENMVSELAGKDVVITTYNVLQAEIHFTVETPERSLRHEKKYDPPKSPLTHICWWRVCLDEAQQIESGVSNAAKVAKLIPRINSWGISGTPVRDNIKDLWGLLVFLHYEPFASSPAIWEGLITSHKHLFEPLFNRIALRHTKRAIRNELPLPRQHRYVINMPFTPVEEQRYREQYSSAIRLITRDETGEYLRQSWSHRNRWTISMMQRTLALLRQASLHPSLGPSDILGKTARKKVLQTVEEVLDAMIESSETNVRNEQRVCLLEKLKAGQILEGQHQVQSAIKVWEEVLVEVEGLIGECRKQLQEELDKEKQPETKSIIDDQIDADLGDDIVPGRVGEYRRKLRGLLDLLHRALFFTASGYYQLKTNEDLTIPGSKKFEELEAKETLGYEAAKRARREILHEIRTKVMSSIARIQEKAAEQSFAEIPQITFPAFHGLESRQFLDNFQMLAAALNEQASLVDELREAIIQMLARPLVDEEAESEVTGEEYDDSAKLQDELMVYTLVLRAAIADRQDAVSGLQNERVKYDTRFAERQAKEGKGHAPEKVLELLKRRQEFKPDPEWGSFRGIVTSLRELATKLRHEADSGKNRARIELEIVESQLYLVQTHGTSQSKSGTELESELNAFLAVANARVEYYKQLQEVSDTVVPIEQSKANAYELAEARKREGIARNSIQSQLPTLRYLLHLKASGQGLKEEETCVICQDPFTLGVLTPCGHQFCKKCIAAWMKVHLNCPICKSFLADAMLHDITLKKPEMRIRRELTDGSQHSSGSGSPSKSKNPGIYTEFDNNKLEAIKSIQLPGPSHSTKINTLAKHLIWLRVEDPGAKSIIFSQFPQFLKLLARAFDEYKIGHTSFKARNGIKKFKEDPAIECLIMDARTHSSGLNLVNASHVFLCEPLLNTALELQAIARVDRIGQEHDTTVWLYLIDGTVEETIYDLSVQRRLKHLNGNGNAKKDELSDEMSYLNIEAANAHELLQARLPKLMNKDHNLGEVVPIDDLWRCLFGHINKNELVYDEEADNMIVRAPRGRRPYPPRAELRPKRS
ncbi:SNF2 family N-terminal domain-containing protein [Rostrohypoxylon terebratum]|nr:SNF2 family N-terminal domain-containing protein [Rostrohypoxylon terebratum]